MSSLLSLMQVSETKWNFYANACESQCQILWMNALWMNTLWLQSHKLGTFETISQN